MDHSKYTRRLRFLESGEILGPDNEGPPRSKKTGYVGDAKPTADRVKVGSLAAIESSDAGVASCERSGIDKANVMKNITSIMWSLSSGEFQE